METYSALPTNQESIANVVKFMLDNNYEIGKLQLPEEIEALLQYFQEGCETMSDVQPPNNQNATNFRGFPVTRQLTFKTFAHYHIADKL